jgi:hypothetical protein
VSRHGYSLFSSSDLPKRRGRMKKK